MQNSSSSGASSSSSSPASTTASSPPPPSRVPSGLTLLVQSTLQRLSIHDPLENSFCITTSDVIQVTDEDLSRAPEHDKIQAKVRLLREKALKQKMELYSRFLQEVPLLTLSAKKAKDYPIFYRECNNYLLRPESGSVATEEVAQKRYVTSFRYREGGVWSST